MYHPTNNLLEFVELFNSRGEFQDLSGYQLGGSIDFTFPPGTTIPGGGFVAVAKAPPALPSASGVSGPSVPYSNAVRGAGGAANVLNEAGGLLLNAHSADQSPGPEPADGAGH